MNAQVRDRGVYVCVAHNDGGLSQASSVLEVERTCKVYLNQIKSFNKHIFHTAQHFMAQVIVYLYFMFSINV